MSAAPLPDRIAAIAERVGIPVQVDEASADHPLLPGTEHVYAAWAGDVLHVHAGAFAALAETAAASAPDFVLEDEIEAHLEAAVDDREAAEPAEGDEALFQSHAAFRRGEDLPHGWYRGGEAAGPARWIVDLDVFAEVWLSAYTWARLVGTRLSLTLGEDVLEIELPADADPAEALVLEGAGLYESEPFEDEPLPPCGDLHLLFFVV
ncbi:MAG: hypothetical protein QNJ98_15400 [Planctomycetota bacterium]|nr:hypothetical protein [Planctomycetota bacterium]